jgi:hypothetical protein
MLNAAKDEWYVVWFLEWVDRVPMVFLSWVS